MEDFIFYLQLGWEHIISLDALDHQLFVLVLVIAFKFNDFKKILFLVTAFTIGHSITLVLSVLDVIRIPSNWVEFLIPLTIVITAFDNFLMRNKTKSLVKINYWFALLFGLIHGMGFANTARMMLAKEQSLAVPLFGFNIGLELGQIVVISIFLIIAFLTIKFFKIPQNKWLIFISILVFALALKMTLERLPF